jgi:diguanylate cyclase (GGDEF)-like protein
VSFALRSFVQQYAVLDLRKFSPRTFWLMSLAAALVLCAIVAIPQWLSKQARLEVLRSHVGAIAQLAASSVDGDLHRRLLDPANNTTELYERTVEPLVRFHSAYPDIFYVYTMVERDGMSHFVVDTAASPKLRSSHSLRPSAYMEPFQQLDAEPDPDWLQRIAAGQTYVYPTFQRDEYGTFLSGHAPIYDSEGRYSGFVGVDFDLEYYLAQESSFRAISIGTLAAALLLSLLIGYVVARYHYDVSNRIEAHYNISTRDELTNLLNRRGALSAIRNALATRASSYAAILVDVDDLKRINDNHGHATGDDCLMAVAEAMRTSVRKTDICARLGGDEFLIFASACDLSAATDIARGILSKLHARGGAPSDRTFGVSIGIVVASADDADFEAMYRCADQALYKAKAGGRNRYMIFDTAAA